MFLATPLRLSFIPTHDKSAIRRKLRNVVLPRRDCLVTSSYPLTLPPHLNLKSVGMLLVIASICDVCSICDGVANLRLIWQLNNAVNNAKGTSKVNTSTHSSSPSHQYKPIQQEKHVSRPGREGCEGRLLSITNATHSQEPSGATPLDSSQFHVVTFSVVIFALVSSWAPLPLSLGRSKLKFPLGGYGRKLSPIYL